LAAITPDQFIAPEAELRKSDRRVAVASDDIKKLFTLASLLAKETEEFGDELHRMMKATPPKGRATLVSEGLKKLKAMHGQVAVLSKILSKVLWLEVRRQHPDLSAAFDPGIRKDWSLVVSNDVFNADDDCRACVWSDTCEARDQQWVLAA